MDNADVLWRSPDLGCLVLSVLILTGYHILLWSRLRHNPYYSIQAINHRVRAAWVESVVQDPKKDVLAVQTLRNSMTGGIFMATQAILLVIGTLTLSGLGNHFDAAGYHGGLLAGLLAHRIQAAKLLLLLLSFLIAFFCFAQSIRIFNHVGYMINLPPAAYTRVISVRQIIDHLNRGGLYYSLGMRAYYLAVPLVFWLFSPYALLLASIGLVGVLYRLDRTPRLRDAPADWRLP